MRTEFEKSVLLRLRRQARRLRLYRAVEGLGVVAVVTFAALAIQLLLDWSFRLRFDMRVALLAVVAATVLWAVWRYLASPLRLAFGVREMASAVERRFPQLDALLVSAVRFDAGEVGDSAHNSPQLVASVIDQAAAASKRVRFEDVLDPRRPRRASGKILGVLLATVVALLAAPQTLGIWFDRNLLLKEVSWPKRTMLIVDVPDDGIVRGAIGDDLEIRARVAEGYDVPRQVEIVHETESGKVGRESMVGVGERGFRITFPRVREAFRFRLSGGDDTTPWYETQLIERPHIKEARLTVVPPAYTRLEPIVLPAGQRAAEMHLGGRLLIDATCSKPVVRAALVSGSETVAELEPEGLDLRVEIAPDDSRTYHFDLLDEHGFENTRPVRFSVRILEDETPKVRLQLANVGNMVTQAAVLPVDVEFSDDLGLADALLTYQIAAEGATAQTIALEGFSPYDKVFSARHDWPLDTTDVEIGQQISLFARARDFDDVGGPKTGESTTITFRVVTDEELLAEFTRREQEYRRQFERLVESQERLRGELLTLLGRMDDAEVRKTLELRLAPLERRQRQIVAQVNIIRQQFEQILTEMAINRLDTSEARRRLGPGIIEPLIELGRRELVEAADQLRQLGREGTAETARAVDPLQAEILARMRQVLDNMLKWEGYQETVTMLREILRYQRELNAETKEEIERQAEGIFED